MTYVLGFRVANSCFLIADAAVTTDAPLDDAEYTAFNERCVIDRKRPVAVGEGALKIFNFGHAAVSGAGNRGDLITTVAQLCNQWLKTGADPDTAFRNAVSSVTPLARPTDLQAALIWRADDGAAKLVSFNASHAEEFKEHDDDVLQLGSIDANHKGLTQSLVNNLRAMDVNDQQACAIAVGLCRAVYSYFRGNVLVSVSSYPPTAALAGKFRFRIRMFSNDGTVGQAERRSDEALRDIIEGIPDYLVFLDQSAPRGMVAEILGQPEHPNIRVGKLDMSNGVRPLAYQEHLKEILFRADTTQRRRFHFERA